MGDKEDLLKIRQLENELKEVKKENRALRFFITLQPSNSERKILLQNGHKFTPDFDAFIHNGAAYCRDLNIQRWPNGGAFAGQPPDFFDNLIKHSYETEKPDEMVANLNFELALNNPASWPTVLVQLHAADLGLINKEQLEKDGVPTLKEEKVDYGNTVVQYTMSNKHKSEARFKLCIYFEGGAAKCYEKMTGFAACRTDSRSRRGRRRNVPPELKVEIVDCFPVENAVHFLANVPNRLIIHHCAPRVRRILQMIDQIAADYARTLLAHARTFPAFNSDGFITIENGHKYTPEIDVFLRYGGAHCHWFTISRGMFSNGFVGYPANFFDDLIKHYYETKAPTKAVYGLNFLLSLENPSPWPAALVHPKAGEMNVEKSKVCKGGKYVKYMLHNKHTDIAFKLRAYFEGGACYEQMTCFCVRRVEDDVQSYDDE